MDIRSSKRPEQLARPDTAAEIDNATSEAPCALIVTGGNAPNIWIGREAWRRKQHAKLLGGVRGLATWAAQEGLTALLPQYKDAINVGFVVLGTATAVHKVLSDGRISGGEVIDLGKAGTKLASAIEKGYLLHDFTGPDDGSRPVTDGSSELLAHGKLAFGTLAKVRGEYRSAVSDPFSVRLEDGSTSRYLPQYAYSGQAPLGETITDMLGMSLGGLPYGGALATVIGASAELLSDAEYAPPGTEAARLFGA